MAFCSALLSSNWKKNVAYAELFNSSAAPSLVYEEQDFSSLSLRVGKVALKILSIALFPLIIAQTCYEWCHQGLGWYLAWARLKDRKEVLHFIKNWDLSRSIMATGAFTAFLSLRLGMTKPPEMPWIMQRIPKALGAKDKSQCDRWQYQRFAVKSGGDKLDAIFMGRKRSTWWPFSNPLSCKRVILYCCSEDELAEGKLLDKELLTLAEKTHSDIVVYNHPGVGASEGPFSRAPLVKATQALFRFLESRRGLGAKEVICYGHSMGAAILLEALRDHKPLSARYAVVLSSAFSTLQTALSSSSSCVHGFVACILGWNFDNRESLKRLQAPAILLQNASVDDYEELTPQEQNLILPDTILESREATLAHSALATRQLPGGFRRKIVGIPRCHDDNLTEHQIARLAKDLHQCFKTSVMGGV